MTKHILLLRGINVGGHRKIKMADLKTVLEGIELQDVQTYIQSGNIVFNGKGTTEQLRIKIEQIILEHFGFEVKSFLIPSEAFKEVFENNPFLKNGKPIEKLYCTFLFATPDTSRKQLLDEVNAPGEEYFFSNNIMYCCYENGYGNAKISNPFIEGKLKVNATTRNWKTMIKLMEMTSQ